MNVFAIYDTNEKDCVRVFENLVQYIKENNKDIKITQRYNSKANYDLFVILSNDINKIINTKEKYDIRKNYIIFTSKLNKDHILRCMEYTSYISFLNNPIRGVCKKIEDIYEKIYEKV